MNLRDILLIYEYNYWATRRILDASAQVSPEQYIALTAHSFGSLRATLVHMLDTEYGWRMLLQHNTIDNIHELKEESFSNIRSLQTRWEQEEQSTCDYLAELSDEDLTDIIRYTTSEGKKRERVRWHCLLHVVNHGTQHRSEAAAILTGFGHSPGDLDFTVFLNER